MTRTDDTDWRPQTPSPDLAAGLDALAGGRLTAAEVQAVAKKYFTDDTLTIGVLEPQPLDGKPRRPSAASRH